MTFGLDGPYIELISLLKLLNIAETGGQAKMMVEEGMVQRNGEPEWRKRAKLIPGDIIVIDNVEITITSE
jgi:ribosome-associated protein